jgi:hypothetical protein
MNMYTVVVKWAPGLFTWDQGGVNGGDFWNTACFVSSFTNCPPAAAPDYDFGSAPNEITYQRWSDR